MKASRARARSHWYGVGRRAAMLSIPLGRVETGNATINMIINEGYSSVRKDAEDADERRKLEKKQKPAPSNVGTGEGA